MKSINEYIHAILALLIVVLSFAYFFVSLFFPVNHNDQILIAIIALCSAVTGYFYGATTRSKRAEQIKKP